MCPQTYAALLALYIYIIVIYAYLYSADTTSADANGFVRDRLFVARMQCCETVYLCRI